MPDKRQDQFLADPKLLKGMPKKTICDYVEENIDSKDCLVPKRYNSSLETMKAYESEGTPTMVMIRSEHPQDYAGCSGLFPTVILSGKIRYDELDPVQFKENVLNYKGRLSETPRERLTRFCKILQITPTEFIDQFSFSWWQYVPGINMTITADSAIKGRYHITTAEGHEENNLLRYYALIIIENNRVVQYFYDSLRELPGQSLQILNNLDKLIRIYEQIRSLPKFDPKHCPTMEFQAKIKGERVDLYFLQYHRTREFDASDFELDEHSPIGTVEFRDVRGKTPKGGIDCRVVIAYAAEHGPKEKETFAPGKWSWYIPEQNEGAINAPISNLLFDEIMARKRNIQISSSSYFSIASGHDLRSLWFKPEVSVICHDQYKNLLISDDEIQNAFKIAGETGENQYINIHVECDGRKAFIQRI